MFPDNLYISDPTGGKIYVVYNDRVERSFDAYTDIYGFLVAQNQLDFYTVNRYNNSITRYQQLESIGDIRVGKMPWGICEDPSGKIYVTNYADNTVSLIKDGIVTKTITVDRGPRGIVSDNNGTIWVACYLSNSVVKIVNNIVVESIKVPYQPEGITCAPNGEVWVTCSASNVVVNLKRNGKHLTFNTGKCPVAVVTDKKGHVFTANFEDDTVTMIGTPSGEIQTIGVGDGPSAISLTSNGMVYVTSNLSGEKIYKINPAEACVVDTIEVCKGQSAFGDFTGCATYNCFNPSGGGVTPVIDDDVVALVKSMKPGFKVTSIIAEDGNYKIMIGSDTFDLTKFDHLKLNGYTAEDGVYTIPVEEAGSALTLVGYFEADDSDPITFASVDTNSTFSVEVGLLTNSMESYTTLNKKKVDLNNECVASIIASQQTVGNIVLAIPTRSYPDIKDTILAQGMMNIDAAWDLNNLVTAQAVKNVLDPNFSEDMTYLVNNLETFANQKWLFQIFKS
jgi:YVTN family beta-propeller protein